MKCSFGISNFLKRSLVFPILSHILAFWERKTCLIEQRNMRYCWRWLKLFHADIVGDNVGICVWVSVCGMENKKAREFWSDISIKDLVRGATVDNTERDDQRTKMVGFSILGGRDKDWRIRLVCIKLETSPVLSLQSFKTLCDPMVAYVAYGRKQRGSKEPLNESEKRRVKKRLKIQHSKDQAHGIQSHLLMANRWGNNANSDRLYFLGLQNHCRWWLQPWN